MTDESAGINEFLQDIQPFFYRHALTYVDVGAHEGKIFERVLRSSLSVREAHLIEPNAAAIKVAKQNTSPLFSGDDLQYHNMALGAAPGRAMMRAAKKMTKIAAFTAGQLKDSKENSNWFEVECSTLDELADSFCERRISLLKIDVEGYELEVLKGARSTLHEHRADVIYIEAGMNPAGTQQCYYRDIEDLLVGHKYRLFKVYEQKHEWLTDSPILRRVNLAFMSEKFASNNPYRVSTELYRARTQLTEAQGTLETALRRATSAEVELQEFRARADKDTEKHSALVDECNNLRSKLALADASTSQLASNLVDLKEESRRFVEFSDAMKRNKLTLEQELLALRSQRDEAIHALRDSDQTRKDLDRQLCMVNSAHDDLLRSQAEAVASRSHSLAENKSLLQENRDLQSRVTARTAELEKLKGELKSLSSARAAAAGDRERYRNELDSEKRSRDQLENKLREVFQSVAQLHRRELRALKEAQEARNEINQVRSDLPYRLGEVIVKSSRSTLGIARTPLALWREFRRSERVVTADDNAVEHTISFKAGKELSLPLTLQAQLLQIQGALAGQELWADILSPHPTDTVTLEMTVTERTGKSSSAATLPSQGGSQRTVQVTAGTRVRLTAAIASNEGVRLEVRRLQGPFCILRLEYRPPASEATSRTAGGGADAVVALARWSSGKTDAISGSQKERKGTVAAQVAPREASHDSGGSRKALDAIVGSQTPRLQSDTRSEQSNIRNRGELSAADLTKKLWAGFSQHASKDLDSLLRSTAPITQKVHAAWELARFYAAEGQWDRCDRYLEIMHGLDKEAGRKKRARLLKIEALLALSRCEKAKELALFKIEEQGALDADYYCALSNIFAVQPSAGASGDGQARLGLLNKIYEHSGLLGVDFIESSKGFTFGNLKVAGDVARATRAEKISVLVPVYNAEAFLAVSIASILAQTWSNIELILVDDCSTDASWSIIQRFAEREPRIVCSKNPTNMGAYQTRNRALAMATGDFTTVHDSDDWSHPQMLQFQIEAMLKDPSIKVSFTNMARVSLDLKFALRPERNNLEYVHRSYPSLLIRREDLQLLDKWDGVTANADDEFVQRARAQWGDQSLHDLLPNVPMSLFLKHAESLTSQKGTSLRSLTFGVRHEYAKQAIYWKKHVLIPAISAGTTVSMERASLKQPFPIPSKLAPKHWAKNSHYDVVIISDLSLLGGTRRCNEGYIAAARNLGMRVGLFHWPRYDLRLAEDIAGEYRALSYNENIDILTPEDQVSTGLLLIHHPPILKFPLEAVPKIDTKKLAVLVNQLPRQLTTESDHYYGPSASEAECRRLFGLSPVWIPISPLVRRFLQESGFSQLATEDWIPPLGREIDPNADIRSPQSHRAPIIGRHSRDHWTKWPEVEKDMRAAYCAGSHMKSRFLGGTKYARKIVSDWPDNWHDLAFDSISVSTFLKELDFFLHFTHSEYIEEFGRNIMESMADGIPVIVPSRFKEVFGGAAAYADPIDVQPLITELWSNKSAYHEQAARGVEYVKRWASGTNVERRLEQAVSGHL